MVVEYLNAADARRLVDLLSDGKVKFSSLERMFKETFPKESFYNVSKAIQKMVNGMIVTPEGIGLVSSFFVLDIMCKVECETAKSVFYGTLLELERAVRQDLCVAEEIKYASKDVKEGKKAGDTNHAETYRLHCVSKEFAFRLLAGKVSSDDTPQQVVCEKQEQVDLLLNTWETNSLLLKEALAGIAHCWSVETERNTCEALSKNAAPIDPGVRAAMILRVAQPQLPSLPVAPGELQFLLLGPSSGDLLLLDSEPATDDWRSAKKLIALGCEGSLTREEQQQLIQAVTSGNVCNYVGINAEMLSRLAAHNPDVSAALILKLPSNEGSQSIQHILKSTLPPENVETVLLHASRILQQVNIRAYITGKTQQFKEITPLAPSDKNTIKSFIMTLHQLVTKASKDNKEIYIADALKSDISQLCNRCEVPEVTARWEELK